VTEPLYWHCASCGGHEPAQAEYALGDWEPCITCENGVARVMTLQEAARVEQRHAMGKPPPQAAPDARALADSMADEETEVTIGYINESGAGPAWCVWERKYPEEGCVGYFEKPPTLEQVRELCPQYVIGNIELPTAPPAETAELVALKEAARNYANRTDDRLHYELEGHLRAAAMRFSIAEREAAGGGKT
jgi:hypothetical protein